MTTLLTTMRQRLADAESDADRLRAAIQILEQSETTQARSATAQAAVPRTPRRRRPAATHSRAQSTPGSQAPAPAPQKKAASATSASARQKKAASATPAPTPQKPTSATPAPSRAASPSPTAAPARTAPNKAAPKKAAPKKRRGAAAKAKTGTAVVPLEKLLKVVGENPGLSTTALATRTGGRQSALLELLKESEQKGEVRREGQRRATSWYRVTDEDRIAVRAAEIAAQSTSANGGAAAAKAAKK